MKMDCVKNMEVCYFAGSELTRRDLKNKIKKIDIYGLISLPNNNYK